jgi:hypothetical protein
MAIADDGRLGMLASKSPFAGVAIGEGGLAGMQAYSNERTREDRINSEAKKLAQEAEFAQKRLDLATRPSSRRRTRRLEARRLAVSTRNVLICKTDPIPNRP